MKRITSSALLLYMLSHYLGRFIAVSTITLKSILGQGKLSNLESFEKETG